MQQLQAAPRRDGPEPIRTLGHGNRGSAELIGSLGDAGARTLLDVRSHPGSRRFPRFDRDALAAALAEAGIAYRWCGRELGGKRRTSAEADARHPALGGAGFRAFAAWMESQRFAAAVDVLCGDTGAHPAALLCAEEDPARCHRWLIADYLVAVSGVPVLHLARAGEATAEHRVSAAARTRGRGLRYDRGTNPPLELEDPTP